ncbi:unnamed protein product [Adineta steineri]|uniref:Ion transport domain-containing protein n=2 Tax=Adineta steineri TaxID=433720 RepID=A0A815E3Z0_9BILA|nr:unnamed protein product [Adineta steineri]CAF1474775.1 unnamed protein product [Adineta steineri]CAF3482321.1 unnamed protein product [Adineta steineri]CAF3773952.1 unnamed protein product [Adineta steineri]
MAAAASSAGAAISSMITLMRKQSFRNDFGPLMDYNQEDSTSSNLEWMNKPYIKNIYRLTGLLSFISTCMNTPKTFEYHPFLQYETFIIDITCAAILTIEAIVKMKTRGLLKNESSYLRDRWNHFDAIMVLNIYFSIILQAFELTSIVNNYSYFTIIRSPRPFILVKVLKTFLKFELPNNQIKSILQRSSSQIYNVTMFFLFFMSLYAILGVQFFGSLTFHCVRNDTDLNNVMKKDLMIPDTYCSPTKDGFHCPEHFVCKKIDIQRNLRGYNGFDELATSFFSVYESASQEGWVFLMYRAIDSLPSWRAFFYFITLIFFLAWLVKNVFIAVIIETFAEIRVQFQQMWGSRGAPSDIESTKILQKADDSTLKLVNIDENKKKGVAPAICLKVVQSSAFTTMVMIVVLANTIFTATIKHTHNERVDRENREIYHKIETLFTIFFDLEALFKIFSLGFKNYIRRSIFKFEFMLALGTTVHCFTPFYRSAFTYFQVLRVARLLKSSPLLEDFLNKIFGPGKKLGSLILFTMCLLLITSSISMQLFCFIKGLKQFETFPRAYMSMFRIAMNDGWTEVMYSVMDEVYEFGIFFLYLTALFFIFFHLLTNSAFISMFQVLTQKGWVDVMHYTMIHSLQDVAPFVAIYFIVYHLAINLIVLSLFVAVILDNLELEEDVKMIRQLKTREASAETQQKLPWRLRVFERFPDHPQMIVLSRLPHDFIIPKIRDSFMRQFLNQDDIYSYPLELSMNIYSKKHTVKTLHIPEHRPTGESMKRTAVSNIIRSASNQRLLSGDASQVHLASMGDNKISVFVQQNKIRLDRKNSMRRSGYRPKPVHVVRENGDIGGLQGRNQDDYDIKVFQYRKQQAELKRNQQEEDLRENHPYFDTPLFTISRESNFRKFCQLVVEARYNLIPKDRLGQEPKISRYKQGNKFLGLVTYLDWIMILVTILSAASMSFETPINRVVDRPLLQIAEYAFVICMSVELTLKIFAHGLFFTPKALIRDIGGAIDVSVFFVGLIYLCWLPQNVPANSAAQFLMLLRSARPLRIFILVPDMRKVVYEVCRGFKEILLVSILLVVLMFIFAIYGVQIIGGQLARCNDRTYYNDQALCQGTFWRELYVSKMNVSGNDPVMLVPRVWANPHNFDFDYIGSAMLALFEVLSLEGWLEIRDIIMDRMGPEHAIFVHIFVFIGTLIGLTLFVGVVIANYSENKGTALLTVDQRRWMDLKGRIKLAQPLRTPPRPENSKFRSYIFDITQNRLFKKSSAVLVLLNCALLYKPWKAKEKITQISALISSLFTFLFLVEAVMKSIALGFVGYWQSRRNRFDLLVTILGIGWIVLNFISIGQSDLQEFSNTFGFTVIILRFFTIAGKHATLKMLMLTIIVSFFKSFFIILGMFLLMLVYAFAGVILFGCVKFGPELGRHANFKTVPNAIVLLMRIVTGEDWNKIMHDCMVVPPRCTRGGSYWESDCGNSTASILYFCSFYIIITYIVLNLLVAIIMENFSLFYSNEEDALLSYTDIRHFQTVWNMIDTGRKGVIPARRVKFLLRLLRGRLEVDAEKLYKHMCYEIEKLNNGNDVTFHDVLNMLAYRSVDIRKSLQFEELLAREELEYLIEEEVAKLTIRNWLNKCLKRIKTKDQTNVIKSLQRSNELAFFREAQALTTSETLKKPADSTSGEEERRLKSTEDRQQQQQQLQSQQTQKDVAKRKLDRTITLPTPSNDNSNYRTQAGTRDTPVEPKGPKRQMHQQLQQNMSVNLSNDESYPWRPWQASSYNNGRKDVESWWTNQFQMST